MPRFDIGRSTDSYQRRWSLMGWRKVDARKPVLEACGRLLAAAPFAVDGPLMAALSYIYDLLKFARMIFNGAGEHARSEAVSAHARVGHITRPEAVGLGWHPGRQDGSLRISCGWALPVGQVYPKLGYAAAVIATETSFPHPSVDASS
jgi:hypothetical protein